MFDFNVKAGHWPYRPVRGLDAYLEAMDAYGIERAVVSSLNAVHYLNPQDGNEELAQAVAAHRDRLTPFAVLRPNFTGHLDDLAECADGLGMKGVVLYPNYHEFLLSDPGLTPLMAETARSGWPVCVQAGLEDPRRQFREHKVEEVPAADVGDFAQAHPEVPVVALGLKVGQPELAGEPLPANLFFDTSNYETLGEMESAVERFGADRILFGSNFPLFNARANVDKLRAATLADDDRTAIVQDNALRLLGLCPPAF